MVVGVVVVDDEWMLNNVSFFFLIEYEKRMDG